MFQTGDTIVAVATPPGRGSIGVVRLSGPAARAIGEALVGQPLAARYATFGRLDGELLEAVHDHVIATWFAAPHSYTGEDVVEISTHGNPLILDLVVADAIRGGARHAMPGEFTFRAYLHGKIDLVQAEAVADLVEAMTPAQARAACDQLDGTLSDAIREIEASLFSVVAKLEASLDFPDEGFHFIEPGAVGQAMGEVAGRVEGLLTRAEAGRVLREGLRVVITGRPNVGKSSLFNALVGTDRAIVTAVPGTTRDVVSAPFSVGGAPCEAVDTAGLRDAGDEVEREGIARTRRARASADVMLAVFDGSVALTGDDLRVLAEPARGSTVVVVNKADLGVRDDVVRCVATLGGAAGVVVVSAATGEGLERLREVVAGSLGLPGGDGESPRVTNRRHAAMLGEVAASLRAACEAATRGATEEFLLSDLHRALEALQSVTGRRVADAVLDEIFTRFCVGK